MRRVCGLVALCAVLFGAGEPARVALAQATPAAAEAEPSAVALRLSGLIQTDATLWNQASVDELDRGTGEPLNEDRFVLRRARLRGDVAHGFLSGHLIIDANTVRGPALRLLGAELGVGYPSVDAKPESIPWSVYAGAGLFLIPFGFETQEPAAKRMFLEPSQLVRAIFPGRRDLGARVEARWSFLSLEAAVMNGEPSGSAAHPLRDPNGAKDVIGRVGAEGELAPGIEARVGASLMLGTGLHVGRAETKDMLVWRDMNEDGVVQTTELQAIAGSPAEASRNFDRRALGTDAGVTAALPLLGKLRVYGEIVWAQNADRGLWIADPIASSRDLRELGFMIGLRQEITRHVELGARYDRYEPDLDDSDPQGARVVPVDSTFSTVALAVAWCSLESFRLTLEYDRNDNPLGRSATGEPTTLASDVLTLRAQLELP